MDKLLLIDGNSLTYRAFYGSMYSSRGILQTSYGTPVNAVLTLNRMINKAINEYNPTHIFIAFDKGPKTFRHEKLESYKAGRQKTPPELILQFPIVKEMISKMGIKYYEIDNIEADDLIASIVQREKDKIEVLVLSSDKDLLQLVDENVSVVLPQSGTKPNEIVNINNFLEKYGYSPDQVKDYKGLVGDSSDNLPGVKGVGPKSAVKLLKQFGTLNFLYENIEEIAGSLQAKLINDKEMAFLCKEIATLEFEIEIPYLLEDFKISKDITEDFKNFLIKYELKSLFNLYKVDSASFKEEQNQQSSNNEIEEPESYDKILF